MKRTPVRRHICEIVSLVAAIALVMAVVAGCGGNAATGITANTISTSKTPGTTNAPATAMDVRAQMRTLWMQHGWYMRETVLAVEYDTPNLQASLQRLKQSEDDIAAALAPLYGTDAGTNVANLLKEHVTIALDVANATKAGDAAGLAAAKQRWQQNAADIATVLSKLNPSWTYDQVLAQFNQDIPLLTAMIDAVAAGQWGQGAASGAITTNDVYINGLMKLADFFTVGITAQFPDRFPSQGSPMAMSQISVTPATATTATGSGPAAWPPGDDADDLRTMMRQVWMDYAWYDREVTLTAALGTPNMPASLDRLQKNADDTGAIMALVYGTASGNQLAALLHQRASAAMDVVTASASNELAAQTDATNRWQQNAAVMAVMLSSLNPNWSNDMMSSYLDTHMSEFTDMAHAVLGSEWDTSITPNAISTNDIFINEAMMTADFFSAGIRQQYPQQIPGSAGAIDTVTPPA